jgi:aminoglycoside phosphotransferase (APT) family kinase protein
MPGIKPVITEEKVVTLLQQHFPASLEHLAVIHGGQIAQTFSFTIGEQDYIVRFNKDNLGANFPKEAFISFLERDVFDLIYGHMTRLLDNCPEERYLVHGGYGFSNVIAHEGKITAIVDWMHAMYGDFVYDIAWLNFWSPEVNYSELFRQ